MLDNIAYCGRVEEMTPRFLDFILRLASPSSGLRPHIMRAGRYRVMVVRKVTPEVPPEVARPVAKVEIGLQRLHCEPQAARIHHAHLATRPISHCPDPYTSD